MSILLAVPWMSGSWYLPAPAASVKDINGVILVVGSRIKINGTIVGISYTDLQYGSVTIKPDYPGQGLIGISSLGTVAL